MNGTGRGTWWIIGILVVVALVIFAVYYLTPVNTISTEQSTSTSAISASMASSSQITAVHIDLFIDGSSQAIPSIATTTPGEAVVATPDGVVTFDPPVAGETLGGIFAAFDEPLTPTCIAGYCASASQSLRIYVNGQLWQGDPTQIPIQNDQEIAVVYGTSTQIPNPVPSSYDFPAGE